jgi:hypothetical protein
MLFEIEHQGAGGRGLALGGKKLRPGEAKEGTRDATIS